MSDCKCDPPCAFQRLDDARKARKKMTKAQLLAEFEKADEVFMDKDEWLSMVEHWEKSVVSHLKGVHHCTHYPHAIDT